jgi:hypothetical protein
MRQVSYFLAYFPYFEKKKAYELTLLSVIHPSVYLYPPLFFC